MVSLNNDAFLAPQVRRQEEEMRLYHHGLDKRKALRSLENLFQQQHHHHATNATLLRLPDTYQRHQQVLHYSNGRNASKLPL